MRVFQLYVRGDDAWTDDFVRRAKDNGFTAFCFTVDVAAYSRRERDLVGRFVKPWRASAVEGSAFQASINALRQAGITIGCDPDDPAMYCPIRTLTRDEMATFFVRAMGL